MLASTNRPRRQTIRNTSRTSPAIATCYIEQWVEQNHSDTRASVFPLFQMLEPLQTKPFKVLSNAEPVAMNGTRFMQASHIVFVCPRCDFQ